MMRILHFYPADNQLISQYVDMLYSVMQDKADVAAEHSLHTFTKTLHQQQPDIVHLHGCWRTPIAMAAKKAWKQGARIVLSPHGQLEPWIMRQRFWSDKLPKLMTYQRRIVHRAYAVIVMGRMEEECLKKLRYNPRIETVRNALITETITPAEMGEQVYAVYRKVLDSDPWPLMDSKTTTAVKAFIKAGLTGDHRWLTPDEQEATLNITEDNWRKILLYAHQEHIDKTVSEGIAVTGQTGLPDFSPADADHYRPPRFDDAIRHIETADKDDTERLVKAIRSARKLNRSHRLTIMNLVEMDEMLRHSRADEEKVARRLDDHQLTDFTQRLMAVLASLTGLEEGFMPLPLLNDRKARRIEEKIIKHLNVI